MTNNEFVALSGGVADVETPVTPLPWASRTTSMPWFPGGSEGLVANLRELLLAVNQHEGLLTARITEGEDTTLREAVKDITALGLIEKIDRNHVVVTGCAADWIKSGENRRLTEILHRTVRFFGELLAELVNEPQSVQQLNEIAAIEYDLVWATEDQVRRRIAWMKSLGLIEKTARTSFGLTEAGRQMQPRLLSGQPERSKVPTDTDVEKRKPPPPEIANLLAVLTQETLHARNSVLGYIPRNNGNLEVVQSLEMLVNAVSPSMSTADLITFCVTNLGSSESSFGALFTTLRSSGLIEETAYNIYSPTTVAQAWLSDPNALDLALILHTRFGFFLEIIPMLKEFDRAPELARAGVEHFGMPRPDVGGIRSRMQLLKAAGLIFERRSRRFQATPLGEVVAAEILLQTPHEIGLDDTNGMNAISSTEEPQLADAIATELVHAGTASESPVQLEQAVASAMQFLGFEARHIGGSGKTDVLATVENAEFKTIRIIVDAKAAKSGEVNEGAVDFDTLIEHQRGHKADLVVLVGPGFNTGRTKSRAEGRAIRLVTTHDLADVIRRHDRSPRSAASFLDYLSTKEDRRRAFSASWTQAERKVELIGHVVAVLAKESESADEVTMGALSSDQIYLIVRDEIDPRPAPQDIEDVLQLLQHPLVNVVRTTTATHGTKAHVHRLSDPPRLISAKLRTIATALDNLQG